MIHQKLYYKSFIKYKFIFYKFISIYYHFFLTTFMLNRVSNIFFPYNFFEILFFKIIRKSVWEYYNKNDRIHSYLTIIVFYVCS